MDDERSKEEDGQARSEAVNVRGRKHGIDSKAPSFGGQTKSDHMRLEQVSRSKLWREL